jgi:hypothetical protein
LTLVRTFHPLSATRPLQCVIEKNATAELSRFVISENPTCGQTLKADLGEWNRTTFQIS